MNLIANCICYPFRVCCPCLSTGRTTRTKQTNKTGNTDKSGKTTKTVKTDKEPSSSKQKIKKRDKTTENIRQDSLTKEYKIPDDFKNISECFESQGLIEGETIGVGSYGTVKKVKDIKSGEVMAVKILNIKNDLTYQSSMSELSILIKSSKNVNIIQVKKHFILKNVDKNIEHFFIFMEYANGGNILDRMKFRQNDGIVSLRRLNEKTAKDYFSQTVSGLLFLHTIGVAHKDLKLENILVIHQKGSKDVIKLTDFGLSGIRYEPNTQEVIKDSEFVGTVDYMSPQILRLFIYFLYKTKVDKLKHYDSFRADSWALGVCLYIMICAEKPFEKNRESFNDLKNMYLNMKQRNYKITEYMKKYYSENCLTMISDLLEPNPNSRLSINVVTSVAKMVKTFKRITIK